MHLDTTQQSISVEQWKPASHFGQLFLVVCFYLYTTGTLIDQNVGNWFPCSAAMPVAMVPVQWSCQIRRCISWLSRNWAIALYWKLQNHQRMRMLSGLLELTNHHFSFSQVAHGQEVLLPYLLEAWLNGCKNRQTDSLNSNSFNPDSPTAKLIVFFPKLQTG